MDLYIVARCEHTSKALRRGTCFQCISQFYLHTLHSSASGVNHAFAFPVEAGTHLLTQRLSWPWVAGYIPK